MALRLDATLFTRFVVISAASILCVSLATTAQAQITPSDQKQGHFYGRLDGGFAIPAGKTADAVKTGGAIGGGIGYWVHEMVGVELDYTYSGYSLKAQALNTGDLSGLHSVHAGNLNAVIDLLPKSPVGVYVMAGPGLYYRRVTVDKFEGVAPGTFCDPWLFFCYPAAVPVSTVVGNRSSWDFGVDVGIGVRAKLDQYVGVFAELRYHYVWGPTVGSGDKQRRADGQYVPLTIARALYAPVL